MARVSEAGRGGAVGDWLKLAREVVVLVLALLLTFALAVMLGTCTSAVLFL